MPSSTTSPRLARRQPAEASSAAQNGCRSGYLAQASAALGYDTTSYGATGPVLGQRYRLEIAPVMGTVSFTSMMADYRRYFMPARFYTIATRVMHYGRYGADAESGLLFPLFLGYPTLVRGYDVGTFDAEECPVNQPTCPAFDQLLGSRMLSPTSSSASRCSARSG